MIKYDDGVMFSDFISFRLRDLRSIGKMEPRGITFCVGEHRLDVVYPSIVDRNKEYDEAQRLWRLHGYGV